jgi:hypothetical protein
MNGTIKIVIQIIVEVIQIKRIIIGIINNGQSYISPRVLPKK